MDITLFKNIPLFEILEPDDRQTLASRFIQRRCAKNTVIIHEGDESNTLYIILEGRVKVYLNDETGKEIILNIEEAGEYFGEVSLLDEGLRSASVMTLEDSCFAILKKQDFINFLAEYPKLALKIIQGLAERVRALTENVRSLALMDVYGRIARQLMDLARQQESGHWIIEQRLTHSDLANRIGASTKMVSRIMRDLIKGGYIRKQSHQIIIEQSLPAEW